MEYLPTCQNMQTKVNGSSFTISFISKTKKRLGNGQLDIFKVAGLKTDHWLDLWLELLLNQIKYLSSNRNVIGD